MADFPLRTKLTYGSEAYLLSTVRLADCYNRAPYETMVFKVSRKNDVNYKDLYCQRYYTQEEAEAGHKELLERAKRGERFWR